MSKKSETVLSTDLPLDDELIAMIWRRMIILYDNKFTSKLGFGIDENGYLTEAAIVWSEELSGITLQELKHGFVQLKTTYPGWPPTVLEFRRLCISDSMPDIPTLEDIVSILVTVSVRKGALEFRYGHPLALAISKSVDMFAVRTAKVADAKRIIKPVYDKLLISGWDAWPGHSHEDQKAIA